MSNQAGFICTVAGGHTFAASGGSFYYNPRTGQLVCPSHYQSAIFVWRRMRAWQSSGADHRAGGVPGSRPVEVAS